MVPKVQDPVAAVPEVTVTLCPERVGQENTSLGSFAVVVNATLPLNPSAPCPLGKLLTLTTLEPGLPAPRFSSPGLVVILKSWTTTVILAKRSTNPPENV